MSLHQIYVGMGSNIRPEKNFVSALTLLTESGITPAAISTVYRTKPLGTTPQSDYLNAAILVHSSSALEQTRKQLTSIEKQLGRIPSLDRYAPRTMDLDLLVFDDVVETKPRPLPHPDIWTRYFVAAPLMEIAPGLVLPGRNTPIEEIVSGLNSSGCEPLEDFTGRLKARFLGS